jgi:transcriptional regulator with XRE-family HTH domain
MRVTVQTMKLRDLLKAHGISTIADFRQRADLSRQHAWNLWHGQVNIGLRMARRLEAQLGIPYTVFLELERERPPAVRPPGRPRKRPAPTQQPRPDRFGWSDGDLTITPDPDAEEA